VFVSVRKASVIPCVMYDNGSPNYLVSGLLCICLSFNRKVWYRDFDSDDAGKEGRMVLELQ